MSVVNPGGDLAMKMTLTIETAGSADARLLLARADSATRARYPDSPIHGFDPMEVADGKGAFAIARVDGRAVGCGAVRPLQPGFGEIKKMYVEPEMRGRGIARAILATLEGAARNLGFATIRLETGTKQPEAIRLYESSGYTPIPKYGEFADDPLSVCFEKAVTFD